MSQKQKVYTKLNGKRIFWCYLIGFISIALVLFALYLFFVQNNITSYFIDNNPDGALFASFTELYNEVILWEFLALLGLGGLSPSYTGEGVFTFYFLESNYDLVKVISQCVVWFVLLLFLIFLVVSIVSFIRKSKKSYFIHTIFGIIATAIILFLVSLLSYLLVEGRDAFDVVTFTGSVSDLSDTVAARVTKILSIVVALLALVFLVVVFYLAVYITYTSVSSCKLGEEEVEEEAPVAEEKAPILVGDQYLTKGEIRSLLERLMTNDDRDVALKKALNGMSIYDFIMSFALEELDRQYDVIDYEDAKMMIEDEIKKATDDAVSYILTRKEEEPAPAPANEEAPKTTEQIIVERKSSEPTLTNADIRDIVRSELLTAVSELNKYADNNKPSPVVVEEKVVIKEVPVPVVEEKEVIREKEGGNTVVKIVYEDKKGNVEAVEEAVFDEGEDKTIVIPAPTQATAPEPVLHNAPSAMATEARTHAGPIIAQPDVRGTEKAVEKGEVIKQAFDERILEGDDELKTAYQSLKSLLMSYGLNSRVSSTGDTFRLSKKTYCKITVSGTALKIYLALDPKEYRHSAIPINDASAKEAYKQIPLGFRVKSDLSLRRARDLVVDCMNQNGLTPDTNFVEADYVKELQDNLKTKK